MTLPLLVTLPLLACYFTCPYTCHLLQHAPTVTCKSSGRRGRNDVGARIVQALSKPACKSIFHGISLNGSRHHRERNPFLASCQESLSKSFLALGKQLSQRKEDQDVKDIGVVGSVVGEERYSVGIASRIGHRLCQTDVARLRVLFSGRTWGDQRGTDQCLFPGAPSSIGSLALRQRS